jgi:phage-related protein
MTAFTYVPEFGATRPSKPRVNNIKFGDGYEQRIAYGINVNPGRWELTFANRDQAEAFAIDAFFTARGGVDFFEWTPPGESAEKKWKCQDWTLTPVKGNYYTIAAIFEEVFDPS